MALNIDKVVEVVGEVHYRIEKDNGKAKTYHINMLKRYFSRVSFFGLPGSWLHSS